MKISLQTTIAAFLFISLFSCKKEAAKSNLSVTANSQDEASACVNGNWSGTYATDGLPYQIVADSTFINNGIAQLTQSPWSYFYTSITLPISKCHQINGDSTKLVVYLKNPSGLSGSVAPYDVSLWLYGVKDTGHVQFLADLQQYTSLQVGTKGITNVPELIHLFQEWTELTLEAKNKRLTVYMNGVPIKRIVYSGTKIGGLKAIMVGLKGSGSVDWVKMYNSNTNVLKMQEDFNVNGKSSVNWY